MNKSIIATITTGVIAATLIAAATVVATTADATALDKVKKTTEKLKKSPQNVQDVGKKFGDACLSCW
jgi:hypothetical protein